jgi:hypothetical protein
MHQASTKVLKTYREILGLTRMDGHINETSRLLLLYTFSVSTVIRLRDG